jgi:hypothetical protein
VVAAAVAALPATRSRLPDLFIMLRKYVPILEVLLALAVELLAEPRDPVRFNATGPADDLPSGLAVCSCWWWLWWVDDVWGGAALDAAVDDNTLTRSNVMALARSVATLVRSVIALVRSPPE